MEVHDKQKLRQRRLRKKQAARAKKARKEWIAVIALVLILVALGSICIAEPLRYPQLQQQDAQELSLVYTSYYKERARKLQLTGDIKLYFADGTSNWVNSACTWGLSGKLQELPADTPMTILVEPDAGWVLQIEVGDQVLLDFDYAQKQMQIRRIACVPLGLIAYAIAVYLLMRQFKNKTKRGKA